MSVAVLARAASLSGQPTQPLHLPLFLEGVSAGFPSPADDYVEKTLDLNELCVKHPAATYFVRVTGNSMQGKGIFSGDVLVVDKAVTPTHGDIVIACIDSEFTVKELSLNPVGLIAHHPSYKNTWLKDEQSLEVFGVVRSIVRNLKQ